MNKYKSALSDIMCCIPYGKLEVQEELLEELVEKATPKDVEKTEVNELGYTHECPSCGSYVGTIHKGKVYEDRYCHMCGQRLWWGEEDDA